MSFLRPEAMTTLRRWAEPAAAGGLAGLAIWFGVRWAGQGSVLGWIALAAAALALFWLRAATLEALAARPVTGAGLVVLREGEIGYLGPERGGFLELDDLVRVELFGGTAGQPPLWRLAGREGPTLLIPANAKGADQLPEALTVLPGYSDLVAVGLLQRNRPGWHLVWERTPLLRLS
jgi:hypothetical protein